MNNLILFKIKNYTEFLGAEQPQMDKSIWNVWEQRWRSCQELRVLLVLTQPSHLPTLTLGCFLSIILGHLCSKLLPLLPVPLVSDGHQDTLSLVTDVVMWWSTSLAGSMECYPYCSPIADIMCWSVLIFSSFLHIVSSCKFLQITQDAFKLLRKVRTGGCQFRVFGWLLVALLTHSENRGD